mmetsp:Transcript_3718/g.13331  ORF Transcript_3718/g.13331 Transcript_3718/m.13331 type:complete len:141 (+) Transcript_3718:2269-2691(+)
MLVCGCTHRHGNWKLRRPGYSVYVKIALHMFNKITKPAQTDFHLLTRSSPKRRLTMPSTAPTCSSGSINSFALLQVLIRMTRRKGRTTWESEETIEQSHCLNTNFSDSIELVPLTVCSHSVAPDAQECEDHSMKNVGDVT